MPSNYPDGLSEGTPGAPWNQEDPWPLICVDCDLLDETGAEAGDSCAHEHDFGNTTGPCGGELREQERCPGCNQPESGCYCDE